MMIDWKPMQRRIGTVPDGIMGRATLTALFRHFGAKQDRAEELALSALVHFDEAELFDNKLRFAHFMAQLIHESGGFRYMEEIASGQAYEGRADLGNTEPGDGRRYKGRGPIQLTGRANYRTFGRMIGVDIERHPDVVALPSMGLWVGCLFWKTKGLNALADADDVRGVTRRINGGFNGLADRQKHLAEMKELLA